MLEAEVLKRVLLKLSMLGSTMFRQNVGQAWAPGGGGKVTPQKNGAVLITEAVPIQMGLIKGSSDLIGWTPVKITPNHVGLTFAVFTAVECKRESGGRVSKEQRRFIGNVRAAGGIAGVANSEEAAEDIIETWSL